MEDMKEPVSVNWQWFGIVMIIGLVIGVVAYVMSESKLLKRSPVYGEALFIAKLDGRLIKAIGTPMKDGTFITGSIKEEAGSGTASILIPLTGPEGSADLFVVANKKGDKWEFKKLEAKIPKTGQVIELLGE